MNKVRKFFGTEIVISVLLLTAVSALSYLLFIGRFTYMNDDWYEMFSVGALGPSAFHGIFAIDRPGRAFLMIPLYTLFGGNPLAYNISAYIFRLLGGLCVLWILWMIWPNHKRSAMLASLLFLIYPGFLSQPNAIDYQSHIAGLFFAVLSIALSLRAVLTKKTGSRILLSAVSVLFGIAYLSQMEYYVGFEIVRFVFFFLLAGQDETNWFKRLKKSVVWYLPFLIIPIAFFAWRLFFFQSSRKATDIGAQLGNLINVPKHTLDVWLTDLFQSVLDVVVLAWGEPLYNVFSAMLQSATPLQILASFGATALAVLLVYFLIQRISNVEGTSYFDWSRENLWAGFLIVVLGLIPIIIADRGVSFPDYSRYTLVSLIGAVMILVVIIEKLRGTRFQLGLISVFIGIAVLTHFANGLLAAQSADAMKSFWWQASWRIPQMKMGTTLVVNYSDVSESEDYIVWGPANLIYHPESVNADYPQPGIYSALLSHDAVIKAVLRLTQQFEDRRSIRTYANYRHLLVLSQPTSTSCLHVIDSSQPEFSSSEDDRVMLLAPYSSADQITLSDHFTTPPSVAFGSEPSHSWCFYYEKAAYARQTGDWQTILNLGIEAKMLGLTPGDMIEVMPFLQADAATGNVADLKNLAPSVVANPYIAAQACQILNAMSGLSQPVTDAVNSLYCISPK